MAKATKPPARKPSKPAGGDDDLQGLLTQLRRTAKAKRPRVELREILEVIGQRAFGPWLLLVGIMGLSPLSVLPLAPSLLAGFTLIVSIQVLAGRKSIWLPEPVLRLAVPAPRLEAAAGRMLGPAKVMDRISRPRLRVLTTPLAHRLVAAACVLVALVTPPLELVPLGAAAPSAALAAFGLGLTSRDGLLVLLSLILSLVAIALTAYALLT